MDISIIILNYNTRALTSKAISSIYRFTEGLTFEIILVDNGSTECDAGVFKTEFPGITLIKSPENLGFAKGNNLGIKYASGKYILLLNSDVQLIENSVKKCADKLAALPTDVAVVTCKLIYPDGKIQFQCNRFPSIVNQFLELIRMHKLFSRKKRTDIFLSTYFDHLSDVYPDWVWGAFFMFKRELLTLLPWHKLNEDYFMYCEDMRWCYDFKTYGKRVYYYAGTSVMHLTGKSFSNEKMIHRSISRNELDFILKTKGYIYALIYKGLHVLNNLF